MSDLEDKLIALPEIQKLKAISNLPSRWQTYATVYDHTIRVMQQCKLLCPFSKVMMVSSALHDIGKLMTRTTENGYIIFPGHADISRVLSESILAGLVREGFIIGKEADDCLFIITYHMTPMRPFWTPKAAKAFLNKFKDRAESLMKFSDLDIRGSNPARIPVGMWTKEIQILKDAIEKTKEY